MDITRRNFIKATSAAALTGMAGCQTNNRDNDEDRNTSETKTDANQPTNIEFLQSKNIETVPIVNENTSKQEAGIRLEVEDQNGLENIKLNYNDAHRDEPLSLYDKARNEFEKGVNGEMVPISEEFPQKILAPNTGEFNIEVTDVNGNIKTRNQEIHNLNEKYRADRKRKPSEGAELEDIGNYTTERNWDNLTTNTQELQRMQQSWLNDAVYGPLVDQVIGGEDFSAGGQLFPNWEGEDDGFFDQDAVKNEDDFETLIRWYLPTIMEHDRENYGNAPSSRSNRFGATMEKLINEHHPEAEAQATDVNSMPGHGIFGVQDTKNEKFYLVDTTSPAQYDGAVGRIGDFNTSGFDPSQDINRQNLWDPFHEFEPGQPEADLPYSSTKRSGMNGLVNFVEKKRSNNQVNYDKIFITGEWMDEAYEVLRNGGSIQPITEPIEEMIYNNVKADEPDNIGIYGNLDDTRIAVDSGDEVYEKVMIDNQPQSIEDIESMLETA